MIDKSISFIKNCVRQMSIRNVINLNSALKILFLYSSCIFFTYIFYFDLEIDSIKRDPKKARIAVYSDYSRIGEHILYLRTTKTLKKMDQEYIGASFEEEASHNFFIRHFFWATTYLFHKILKPDFSITLTHHTNIIPPDLSLLYLNVPRDSIYDIEKGFVEHFSHIKNFKGYVDLHSFINGDNIILKEILENANKKDAPIFKAYLSQDTNFIDFPQEYKNLIITGSLWGCVRHSYRMKHALKKLSNDGHLKAYGIKKSLAFLGDAYLGSIEEYDNDAGREDKILFAQNDSGISLLIHNLEHVIEGLPTNRIGEAIMSGNAIISDKHPFIQKYFGENILYFDQFQESSAAIYSEILEHVKWIKSNPEKVREMSMENYKIFVREFALEKQLHELIEQVMKYKKSHKND